jgi:hypothetical protein
MATIKFTSVTSNLFISSGSIVTTGGGSGILGYVGVAGDTSISASLRTVFGGNGTANANANVTDGQPAIYLFKGTPPSSFESFNGNLLTKSDDLLLTIARLYQGGAVTYSNPTSSRFILNRSDISPTRLTLREQNGTNVALTRTDGVVTATYVSSFNTQKIVAPGTMITIANASSSFNGTFKISNIQLSNANLLISWTQSGANESGNVSGNSFYFPPIASANGSATWFCIRGIYSSTSAGAAGLANSWFGGNLLNNTFDSASAIIGTVGNIGSGADLEMNSTTIVANRLYASLGMYMNVPYTWQVNE